MKGSAKVVKMLNEVLTAELTGINQYFVHAEMCENWGYMRLNRRIRAESIDEMRHAEKLIERILYLEGTPNMSRLFEIRIGSRVQDMLKYDLALEKEAVDRLNKAIPAAREARDVGSAELLEHVLTDEEKHVDFLEAQLDQIAQMGLENYLANQVKPDEGGEG